MERVPAAARLSSASGAAGRRRPSLRREVQDYYRLVAPYLDLELADRGDAEFWEWAAGQPPGRRVLELGAGSGRATEFLARAARQVVALDLSPDLIARARRRLAGLRNVALLVADMRRVHLAARFDLVVAVDDPFAHLVRGKDRDLALATAAEHLDRGGRFILDSAWFSPPRRERAAQPAGLVMERTLGGEGGEDGERERLEVREEWRCLGRSRLCSARFEYRRGGRLLTEASFQARLWSVAELERRSRAAGLEIASLWGDYDRRPWDRATSPRLIVEMRRTGGGEH
jgi:SAM-dependent methyltransferase